MKLLFASSALVFISVTAFGMQVPSPEDFFARGRNEVIVRVGGVPITTGAVIRLGLPMFVRLQRTRLAGLQSKQWSDKLEQQYRLQWDFAFRQTLVRAIEDELFYAIALKQKLQAFPSMLEKRTEQQISRMGGEDVLKEHGITHAEVEESARRELLIETVQHTQKPPVLPAGPAEAHKFFQEHTADFTLDSEGYRARMIVLPRLDKDGISNMVTVQEIKSKIKTVDDFDLLARQKSQHPSRNSGGLLQKVIADGYQFDVITNKDVPPFFQDFLKNLKDGEVGGPLEAENSIYLVLIEKHFPPGLLSESDFLDGIIKYLTQLSEQKALEDWVIKLSKDQGITDTQGNTVDILELMKINIEGNN